MTKKTRIIIFCGLIGLVIAIGILHTVTPGHMIFYHDTYRRLSYFPIAIGAILFGWWGGLFMAVASCLAFVPHLLLSWVRGPEAYYSELSEIIFYLAAGVIIGLISSRENRLREKYKSLSEQLSNSYKRLHDQAARLIKAEKQLGESQKLSMLGEVSASLAHEIKNPLASIKGAAEILSEEVETTHPKHEFVEIMKAEIERLNRSVEDVLSYCRGQKNKQKGKQESIENIINKVVLMLETRAKENLVEIETLFDQKSSKYYTDEPAMTQVLVNILLNALEVLKENGKVEIRQEMTHNGCFIRISDNGPGIDKDLHEEVFHSFVTYKVGGTGLGLSISKKIVESLGGKIYIEDSDTGGTAVCILLPETPLTPENGSIQNA